MGEYRRFVSYLYEYRNDRKEKIAGAVRVDCRGARTQIRVDVRESRSPGQAVLLGYGVPAQPLGRVLRSAGAGGESYVWKPESGQPEFAAYSGLEIRYEDSAFCLRTFWDDRIAEAEEWARKEKEEKEEKEETEAAERIEREELEQREKEATEQREEEPAEPGEDGEVLHTLSFHEPPIEEPRLTWEELCRIYPSVQPFGGNDSWEALRIRPQDIGRLPREYWDWGRCPFVEMAYQEHGSLLLLRDPASEQIYLGVPGTLPLQEFKVADLFGFRHHREGRDTGYYLARINL